MCHLGGCQLALASPRNHTAWKLASYHRTTPQKVRLELCSKRCTFLSNRFQLLSFQSHSQTLRAKVSRRDGAQAGAGAAVCQGRARVSSRTGSLQVRALSAANGRCMPPACAARDGILTSRRYEPFLQDKYPINSDGRPSPSAELATSTDVVLTSLAQLGLYQTGTERAFISLFDANLQYIIAEATQSTPLVPGLPSDECPSPLLLSGRAIPRSHGACEHALYVSNADTGNSASTSELPLMLVPDLTTDKLFSSKPYCRAGPSPQFYAAVPIRTSRGINIGTYSVRSSRSDITWDGSATSRLRQISRAIMGHLAANREKHAYRRNERVTRPGVAH